MTNIKTTETKIIDLSGPIYDGMWTYDPPYPPVKLENIEVNSWLDYYICIQKFSMPVQQGTYFETSAHMVKDAPWTHQIPLERLFFDAVIIQAPAKEPGDAVTLQDLKDNAPEISEGEAIFVATGWDRKWREPDYVKGSPWFTHEAMDWILDYKPFLVGADTPHWENTNNPQGFFKRFFEQDTLLIAPVVNLRKIKQPRAKIIALPMNMENAMAVPCRVVALVE
jgi:arylformamidase